MPSRFIVESSLKPDPPSHATTGRVGGSEGRVRRIDVHAPVPGATGRIVAKDEIIDYTSSSGGLPLSIPSQVRPRYGHAGGAVADWDALHRIDKGTDESESRSSR